MAGAAVAPVLGVPLPIPELDEAADPGREVVREADEAVGHRKQGCPVQPSGLPPTTTHQVVRVPTSPGCQ